LLTVSVIQVIDRSTTPPMRGPFLRAMAFWPYSSGCCWYLEDGRLAGHSARRAAYRLLASGSYPRLTSSHYHSAERYAVYVCLSSLTCKN